MSVCQNGGDSVTKEYENRLAEFAFNASAKYCVPASEILLLERFSVVNV